MMAFACCLCCKKNGWKDELCQNLYTASHSSTTMPISLFQQLFEVKQNRNELSSENIDEDSL